MIRSLVPSMETEEVKVEIPVPGGGEGAIKDVLYYGRDLDLYKNKFYIAATCQWSEPIGPQTVEYYGDQLLTTEEPKINVISPTSQTFNNQVDTVFLWSSDLIDVVQDSFFALCYNVNAEGHAEIRLVPEEAVSNISDESEKMQKIFEIASSEPLGDSMPQDDVGLPYFPIEMHLCFTSQFITQCAVCDNINKEGKYYAVITAKCDWTNFRMTRFVAVK